MVQTQVQLTEEQMAALEELSKRRNVSITDLIREGVDNLLRSEVATNKQADLPEWVKFALDEARKIEEMGIQLPSDLAEHHDHYAHGSKTDNVKIDDRVRNFVERLSSGLDVEEIILFGSRARGDHLIDSDYNFIIVSKDFEGIFFPDRCKLIYKYWDKWDCPVEALCYTPQEFDKKSSEICVVSEAVREGEVLKG